MHCVTILQPPLTTFVPYGAACSRVWKYKQRKDVPVGICNEIISVGCRALSTAPIVTTRTSYIGVAQGVFAHNDDTVMLSVVSKT